MNESQIDYVNHVKFFQLPKTSYKNVKDWSSENNHKPILYDNLLQVVIWNIAIIFNLPLEKDDFDDKTKQIEEVEEFEEVDVLTSMG